MVGVEYYLVCTVAAIDLGSGKWQFVYLLSVLIYMQTIQPTKNSERELFLDALRGFAILGIFIGRIFFQVEIYEA